MKLTYEDKEKIRKRKANPNIIEAPKRDISGKIANARREIKEATAKEDLETRAVIAYLQDGLQNCQRYGDKDRVWPMGCQDCQHNKTGDALCSLIKEPTVRTMEVLRLYAESLKYLAKLKNPEVEIEPAELVFKAFELTGAYQHLLNPIKLREHFNHSPKLMVEVVEKLKRDYEAVKLYILASIGLAVKGEKATRFFKQRDEFGLYDKLSKEKRKEHKKVEPYEDKREIGMNWMHDFLDGIIEETHEKQGE